MEESLLKVATLYLEVLVKTGRKSLPKTLEGAKVKFVRTPVINDIEVYTWCAYVGDVRPHQANILTPLLDRFLITLEGTLHMYQNQPKIRLCRTDVYARVSDFDEVRIAISGKGISSEDNQQPYSADKESIKRLFAELRLRCKVGIEPLDPLEGIRSNLYYPQKQALGWCVNRERNGVLEGGILADEHGTTLTMLALIASDASRKTTLIVCPRVSAWVKEIKEHTRPNHFKVLQLEWGSPYNDEKFSSYDIVIATYTSLSQREKALHFDWTRIILDDDIRRDRDQELINIKAKHRWIILREKLEIRRDEDLVFQLMRFLRFKPFSSQFFWATLIGHPPRMPSYEASSWFEIIMDCICLRRSKENCSARASENWFITSFVTMNEEEREEYDRLERDAIYKLILTQEVITQHAITNILMSLSQSCSFSQFSPIGREIPDDSTCCICFDDLVTRSRLRVTTCNHVFCPVCFMRTEKNGNIRPCPLCRTPLEESDIYRLHPKYDRKDLILPSKFNFLLKLVSNSCEKSAIISQFQETLFSLAECLRGKGYEVFMDSSHDPRRIKKLITSFSKVAPREPGTILLASLKSARAIVDASGVSKLYLLEPCWDINCEHGGICYFDDKLTHKQVQVVTLISKDTIEERLVLQQEENRQKRGKILNNCQILLMR